MEGFDLLPAGPKLHLWKRVFKRRFPCEMPLAFLTPIRSGFRTPTQTIQNAPEMSARWIGWDGGIRTPDHGTRTHCLTTWLHPNILFINEIWWNYYIVLVAWDQNALPRSYSLRESAVATPRIWYWNTQVLRSCRMLTASLTLGYIPTEITLLLCNKKGVFVSNHWS